MSRNIAFVTTLVALVALTGVSTAGAGPVQLFSQLTEREEIAIGRAAARQVERENRLVRHPGVVGYVQSLGEELARQSDRPDLRYRFRIIDRKEVNAFALPGGFIYVNRGLILLAKNESELAGVLAHEISHVTERHGVEQAKKAQTIGLGLGLLDIFLGRTRNTGESLAALGANLFAQGIFSKHSRDAERDADHVGVELLRRAGINPHGMVTLFQSMDSLRRREPGLVEKFFSSHPSLIERQENISELLNGQDASLQNDSRGFHRAKRELK